MMWALAAISLTVTAILAAAWQRARMTQRRCATQVAEQSQHNDELSRQVARYRGILNSAADGFFVLGEDYRFLEVNPAFCRLVGYSADELRQMKMTDLEISPQSPDAAAAGQWRTGWQHFATAHRRKDGHVVYLESSIIVLRDGQRKQLVGFAREVTERLRSEQALRKSEAQYRNLVETSRDLIWSIDLDGRWTFVNSAARTIYGYEPEEMIGRPVVDFAHPEQRPRTLEILDEIRAGKPRFRFETQHLRKDGTPVHLSVSVIPVRDDYGQVVACTGTSTDITYRREAEQRLREAHDRFASLVARMPLGYIVWSPEFRVVEWNPAATSIFGYPPEQALGQAAADLLVPDEGRAGFSEMVQRVLRGEPCSGTLLVNRRQDGEKIRCEWHCTPLPDAQGRIQGVVTLVRDVSERERLEAQLRQSQKLESLGVLAGGVAHDFNNLLVGIMGNASLAMEQLPPQSPLRPLLERVVNAGRRATDLTQRMLAYAGRATCDVQLMDLNALVREMVDFAAAAIPKNVALHIDAQPDLPLLKADSGQIQQVIMNLVINAAEAIGTAAGDVTVATWAETLDARRIAAEFSNHELQPGLYVVLEVRDTGCGMTPEVQSRIFDPFFTTKFAGRGLGLSAILGIVRAHRGAITVSSQVGVGTVFRVWFPAVAGRAKVEAPAQRVPTLPRGATVLVIDDEEDIRDVVEAVLSRRGLKVLTAADGQQALDIFRQQASSIDVVLLDMNMPGLSGEAVFRALREIRPDIRVLLSTGYSEQEAALRFADAPLAGFVHKPYTATSLVEKIGAAIAG